MCFKKAEYLKINMFNTITGMNESITLTNHISCKYTFEFDGRKCYSNKKWNDDKCMCECKNSKKKLFLQEKKLYLKSWYM